MANTRVNGQRPKTFSLKLGTKYEYVLSPTQHCTEGPNGCNQAEVCFFVMGVRLCHSSTQNSPVASYSLKSKPYMN